MLRLERGSVEVRRRLRLVSNLEAPGLTMEREYRAEGQLCSTRLRLRVAYEVNEWDCYIC